MPTFDAIGIVAADPAASTAFYRLLGVPFPDLDDTGHVEAPIADGVRLMIDTEDVMRSFGDWEPPAGGGRRMSLAFRCADPAEVDRTHDALVVAGHPSRHAPFDAPWGQRYATVEDPDGNPVDLYAALGSA